MKVYYTLSFQRANFHVGNQFFERIYLSDCIQVKTVLPFRRKYQEVWQIAWGWGWGLWMTKCGYTNGTLSFPQKDGT